MNLSTATNLDSDAATESYDIRNTMRGTTQVVPTADDFVSATNAGREKGGLSVAITPRPNLFESFRGTKASSIRVAVVGAEENSVECEAEVAGGRRVRMQLAPGLFPVTPRFGMSFDLSMVTENGIQRPSLEESAPAPSAHAALKDEIARLIERL